MSNAVRVIIYELVLTPKRRIDTVVEFDGYGFDMLDNVQEINDWQEASYETTWSI